MASRNDNRAEKVQKREELPSNFKIFLKLLDAEQDFVIRIRKNRKLFYQNRWFSATELCARRKGKVKMKLRYRGKDHDAYLSHVKVQLTASKREVNLVLVYGITENPMMLVTNKPVRSKADVMAAASTYFGRWRIEEHFRFMSFLRFFGFLCSLSRFFTSFSCFARLVSFHFRKLKGKCESSLPILSFLPACPAPQLIGKLGVGELSV